MGVRCCSSPHLAGISSTFSSDPLFRIFVTFFSLTGLTSRSLSRLCSPIIMPGYTSVLGPRNRVPLASNAPRACSVVFPSVKQKTRWCRGFSPQERPTRGRFQIPDGMARSKHSTIGMQDSSPKSKPTLHAGQGGEVKALMDISNQHSGW